MTVESGAAGASVRSDVLIRLSPAERASVKIESSVMSMYGQAIRAQVERVLNSFGDPAVLVEVDDSGALPFAIEARLEAALCRFLRRPLPQIEAHSRAPSPRHRRRRTRLYIPGNSPKLMPNAGLYGADCIILDLEDAVPEAEKDDARALVRRALEQLDFGPSERWVRVNAGARLEGDISAILSADPDGIFIPKVESADDIQFVERLAPGVHLIAIIETAQGIAQIQEIAQSSGQLVALTLGIEDYLADIHATDREAAYWALGAVRNAARSTGLSPLAPVISTIDDDEETERFARTMRHRGFDGIGCIHPRQIAPAHRGFAPDDEERGQAERIVAAFEAAESEGVGAIRVDGKMVDAPVYRRAKQLLAWSDGGSR